MTHPAILDARQHLADEELRLTALEHARDHRLKRAVMIAPTLDICRALLAGERVPLSQLDAAQFQRYGIRRAA